MKKRILGLMLLLALLSAFAPICAAAETRTMRGMDVSQFQGEINFEAVRASGIEAVYIRAAYGLNFIDPYFEENYRKAKAAGLKIGFYHFITAASTEEATSQAKFFYRLMHSKDMDMYPAMDFETFNGLNRTEINEIALAYVQTLRSLLGYRPAVYTDVNHAENIWTPALSVYPLWIADYSTKSPSRIGAWADWDGFQYSDAGRVAGIEGNVDLDQFRSGLLIGNLTESADRDTDEHGHTVYVVQSGDTLSQIAAEFHTTFQAIANFNQIRNPNRIFVGEVLYIPDAAQPTPDTRTYTVRYGDTLWQLARKFHTTVQTLAEQNHIKNPDWIYVGQRIEIPR